MSQAKPRLAFLSVEQIHQVHAYSLEILATTGVRVDSPRAHAIFERALGRAVDGDRVRAFLILLWETRVIPKREIQITLILDAETGLHSYT